MIKAAIFDMDSLLIDSEPLWSAAEYSVFSSLGVTVSPHLAALTATMTTRDATQFWYQQAPWTGTSLDAAENAVLSKMQSFIRHQGQAMAWVISSLEFLKQKGVAIGLATNSPYALIDTVLNTLGIAHYFHAASSAEHESQGKPSPDVYVSTARRLSQPPEHCVAFEDSYSGLQAASNACMKTVAVPAPAEFGQAQFALSDLSLRSLCEFGEAEWLHLQSL